MIRQKGSKVIIISLLFIFIISYNSVFARKKWVNFTDLKNITCLAMDKQSQIAYCGTTGGLFLADLNNGSIIKQYTNIQGLISNNITALTVDNQNKIWIGSSDGSICILDNTNSTFRYILDIKNSTETSKGINAFITYGSFIFVATNFGIIKISTGTYNFIDAPYYQLGSYNSKSAVFDLTILNNKIFAATVSGVAYADFVNSNLNNPSSWTNYNIAPLNANVKTIKSFNGYVFVGSNTGFVYYDGSYWVTYPNPDFANTFIKSISPVGNRLYFISNNKAYSAHIDSLVNVLPYNTNDVCNVIISDNNQNPIIGISEKGIYVKVNSNFTYIAPNCPNRNSFEYISEDTYGNIWAASGLFDGGFYKFDGLNWSNFTKEQNPLIGNTNDFRKVICGDNAIWALSWGGGATLIKNNVIRNYSTIDSILPGVPGYPNFCVPYGGAFDNNGYFWMTFYGTNNSKMIYVHLNDTLLTGITNSPIISSGAHFGSMAIDNYNTKWIVSTGQYGLYFYNENGTIFEPNDDVYGFYSTADYGDINTITHVIIDKNNTVWVTTNNGVYILDNPLGAIQNPNNKPAFYKLGIISGNLKVPFTENCKTITVDVLNEKWIGTESNGVFHFSEDGTTLIEQFNTSNSPILSNSVNSIVVSGKTGRAYFATLYGLSSIETNAIQPVEKFDKIICKPNPYIIPSSKSPTLIIDGLVENSTIKIITLNGEVVAEFTARPGRIDDQWNGTDKKGKLVSTGIYIVVAYNKDGSKVGTGKLAVIRK